MVKKVVKKLFFVWNEKKEKEFLEKMALKGYRLVKVQFGKYTFEEDRPKKLIYQFDFKTLSQKNEEEYLQIFEDLGWNFVSRFGGWYYFYREWNEEIDMSIFNNNKSMREKYRRLLLFLSVIGFPLYYQIIILFPNMPPSVFQFPKIYFFIRLIVPILAVLHIFAVMKIVNKYRKLKSNIRE